MTRKTTKPELHDSGTIYEVRARRGIFHLLQPGTYRTFCGENAAHSWGWSTAGKATSTDFIETYPRRCSGCLTACIAEVTLTALGEHTDKAQEAQP